MYTAYNRVNVRDLASGRFPMTNIRSNKFSQLYIYKNNVALIGRKETLTTLSSLKSSDGKAIRA